MKKKKKVVKLNWTDLDMVGNHYVDKLTLAEIGNMFGVSRQRVHQRITRTRKALAV